MAFISKISELTAFMSPLTLSLICILTTILLLYFLTRRNRRDLPPGPYGLPYLGYAPMIGKAPHLTFNKLSKKYGNVFSINVAGQFAVVLCDLKAMKEAYNKPAFLGSGMGLAFSVFPEGGGIIEINGKPWQEQRRFTSKTLKDIGFVNEKFSVLIMDELIQFRQYLEKLNGRPMNFFEEITPSLINVSLSMLIQKKFDYDDPIMTLYKDSIHEIVKLFVGSDFFLLPIVNKIVSKFTRKSQYSRTRSIIDKMHGTFIQEVKEHRRHLDTDHLRDFIDHYIAEVDQQGNNPDSSFTEKSLLANLELFFMASNVDTRSALYWLILSMAAYTDVQSRVQAEIDNVLGRDRFPTWSDHTCLPYTEATMREAHRWKLTTPVSCIRKTLEDTSVGSYFVPKNSLVFLNLWAIHNDPTYWKDPEVFRPERHLTEDGKSLIKHENYIPFSYGKRQCPGEKFAVMEQFVYLVALLQQFNIRMPEGKVADFTEVIEVNAHPKPQDICFIPRQ